MKERLPFFIDSVNVFAFVCEPAIVRREAFMSKKSDPTAPENEIRVGPGLIVTLGLVITFWPVITLFAIAGYMATKREQRRTKAPRS